MKFRLFTSLVSAVISAALGGCVVGPDYHPITPAQAAPEQFVSDSEHTAEIHFTEHGNWWLEFHDEGLNALVKAARLHSPDIATAEANIRQARAGLVQIASARELQVGAEGRISHDQFSRVGENFADFPIPNPETSFSNYKGGLDASWEIDFFGHTARSIESASSNVGGLEAVREDVALSVSAETARNVLDYRHVQLRIANIQAMIADNRDLLHLVQLQRKVGIASDIDVKQAEIALKNAEAALPPLETAAQSAIAALVPLTGMTQLNIFAQLVRTANFPTLPAATNFRISSQVLERRPDIRIAERKLAAATADVGVAMADQYPRFTLIGDAGWDSVHPGQFGQQASRYWNLGPQFNIPVLNGGRVRAEIKGSEAAREAAQTNYRKAVLVALADTESALLRCQGDQGRLVKLATALNYQDDQLLLTKKRVDVGEVPQIDLLNMQVQRGVLDDQKLLTRQALAQDFVLLYKALGGNVDE